MDFEQLRKDLGWLRVEDGVVEPLIAEAKLGRILEPLLSAEGFGVFVRPHTRDTGVDFEARSSTNSRSVAQVGIQYKHFGRGRRIGVANVRELIRTGIV